MAVITQAEALLIVPLATMKDELRIPVDITDHDVLLARQITDAVSFVSKSTGATGDDLLPLRPAAVSFVRELYDGYRELPPDSAGFGWMSVYRSYKV